MKKLWNGEGVWIFNIRPEIHEANLCSELVGWHPDISGLVNQTNLHESTQKQKRSFKIL